jgi:GMP synthase-like glutamine amidotransferase
MLDAMRAHYLQHVPFEGLGCIRGWLDASGFEITCTRLFESPVFPEIEAIDLLVIMGGPMSVNDEGGCPWLVEEKRFVHRAVESGIPVLGICLGAQLIASVMGARVYPNREKEIGWMPIRSAGAGDRSTVSFPPSAEVFHWHGETFDLPPGAVHLASSEACRNQAFQLGASVVGLQFHLETTPESARKLVANCRDELTPSKYVQTEVEILAAGRERYRRLNSLMDEVLNYLLRSHY